MGWAAVAAVGWDGSDLQRMQLFEWDIDGEFFFAIDLPLLCFIEASSHFDVKAANNNPVVDRGGGRCPIAIPTRYGFCAFGSWLPSH